MSKREETAIEQWYRVEARTIMAGCLSEAKRRGLSASELTNVIEEKNRWDVDNAPALYAWIVERQLALDAFGANTTVEQLEREREERDRTLRMEIEA